MKQKAVILLAVLVILVVASPFIITKAKGLNTGKSDLAVLPGCTPKSMNLRISGEVSVSDKKFLTLEPHPQIDHINVLQVSQNYFSIIKTDYVLNVAVVQDGKLLGQSGAIESTIWNTAFDKLVEDAQPYSITMTMPDNNCDGKTDPFRATLVAKLSPEGQAVQQIEKALQFNGQTAVLS